MTARKVKAVKAWALVNHSGEFCLTLNNTPHELAIYENAKSARQAKVGTETVIPVRITPLTKKKGKANG